MKCAHQRCRLHLYDLENYSNHAKQAQDLKIAHSREALELDYLRVNERIGSLLVGHQHIIQVWRYLLDN